MTRDISPILRSRRVCSAPSVGPTRTEEDFVSHVEGIIGCDPAAEWLVVVERLNTHQSESGPLRCKPVWDSRGVGRQRDIGHLRVHAHPSRILKRSDIASHCLVYTPKHSSWLNQMEIWFSILVRRLLKWASFTSVTELRQRLLAFIEYFNKTMAKPFKWTYRESYCKAETKIQVAPSCGSGRCAHGTASLFRPFQEECQFCLPALFRG